MQYYEALDLAVTSITTSFDQKGYHTFLKVEQLLFKACKSVPLEDELEYVCSFSDGDFNKADLATEL